MNDDKKFGNMSEGEFRDLQDAPLQQPADQNADNSATDIPVGLNDDALEISIDKDILAADLDDVDALAPVDLNENLQGGEGYVEVLESDLDEELSDGGPSHDHIHAPDMDAPDTPGEIDIEDLQEGDLEGTGIPADALLDPLED